MKCKEKQEKKCHRDIRNLQENKSTLINNIIGTGDIKSKKIKDFFYIQ